MNVDDPSGSYSLPILMARMALSAPPVLSDSGAILWSEGLALVILILLSAFFSASETALSSLDILRVRQILEREDQRSRALRVWVDRPNRILTTILISNNMVNVGATVIATDFFRRLLEVWGFARAEAFAGGVAFGVMTVAILVFGEIVPKSYAKHRAEDVSLRCIRLLRLVMRILGPVVYLLTSITRRLLRLFGQEVGKTDLFVTEEDIRSLVNAGEESGVLEEGEREMIHSVFEFQDTAVKEVMVPRVDIDSILADATLDEALRVVTETGRSRVPAYEEDIDHIVGFVYAKDLLISVSAANRPQNLRQILRPPFFVPETKKVNELLEEFRRERFHIAIVVDEYGGTAGVVTIEDLIEEIVGEIEDEYDEEVELLVVQENGSILADGKVHIDELAEKLDINLPQNDYESVGGFVSDMLGRIPEVGEEARYEGLRFVVEDADERSVKRVHVVREEKNGANAGHSGKTT